eukprot:GHVN01001536.1.p1 GENE.GHVN01001536.1~~GHVN01001536.1.p1  ORF type:complete len:1589 (-),score=215.03 GHVN01001536.1:2344-7110(-)
MIVSIQAYNALYLVAIEMVNAIVVGLNALKNFVVRLVVSIGLPLCLGNTMCWAICEVACGVPQQARAELLDRFLFFGILLRVCVGYSYLCIVTFVESCFEAILTDEAMRFAETNNFYLASLFVHRSLFRIRGHSYTPPILSDQLNTNGMIRVILNLLTTHTLVIIVVFHLPFSALRLAFPSFLPLRIFGTEFLASSAGSSQVPGGAHRAPGADSVSLQHPPYPGGFASQSFLSVAAGLIPALQPVSRPDGPRQVVVEGGWLRLVDTLESNRQQSGINDELHSAVTVDYTSQRPQSSQEWMDILRGWNDTSRTSVLGSTSHTKLNGGPQSQHFKTVPTSSEQVNPHAGQGPIPRTVTNLPSQANEVDRLPPVSTSRSIERHIAFPLEFFAVHILLPAILRELNSSVYIAQSIQGLLRFLLWLVGLGSTLRQRDEYQGAASSSSPTPIPTSTREGQRPTTTRGQTEVTPSGDMNGSYTMQQEVDVDPIHTTTVGLGDEAFGDDMRSRDTLPPLIPVDEDHWLTMINATTLLESPSQIEAHSKVGDEQEVGMGATIWEGVRQRRGRRATMGERSERYGVHGMPLSEERLRQHRVHGGEQPRGGLGAISLHYSDSEVNCLRKVDGGSASKSGSEGARGPLRGMRVNRSTAAWKDEMTQLSSYFPQTQPPFSSSPHLPSSPELFSTRVYVSPPYSSSWRSNEPPSSQSRSQCHHHSPQSKYDRVESCSPLIIHNGGPTTIFAPTEQSPPDPTHSLTPITHSADVLPSNDAGTGVTQRRRSNSWASAPQHVPIISPDDVLSIREATTNTSLRLAGRYPPRRRSSSHSIILPRRYRHPRSPFNYARTVHRIGVPHSTPSQPRLTIVDYLHRYIPVSTTLSNTIGGHDFNFREALSPVVSSWERLSSIFHVNNVIERLDFNGRHLALLRTISNWRWTPRENDTPTVVSSRAVPALGAVPPLGAASSSRRLLGVNEGDGEMSDSVQEYFDEAEVVRGEEDDGGEEREEIEDGGTDRGDMRGLVKMFGFSLRFRLLVVLSLFLLIAMITNCFMLAAPLTVGRLVCYSVSTFLSGNDPVLRPPDIRVDGKLVEPELDAPITHLPAGISRWDSIKAAISSCRGKEELLIGAHFDFIPLCIGLAIVSGVQLGIERVVRCVLPAFGRREGGVDLKRAIEMVLSLPLLALVAFCLLGVLPVAVGYWYHFLFVAPRHLPSVAIPAVPGPHFWGTGLVFLKCWYRAGRNGIAVWPHFDATFQEAVRIYNQVGPFSFQLNIFALRKIILPMFFQIGTIYLPVVCNATLFLGLSWWASTRGLPVPHDDFLPPMLVLAKIWVLTAKDSLWSSGSSMLSTMIGYWPHNSSLSDSNSAIDSLFGFTRGDTSSVSLGKLPMCLASGMTSTSAAKSALIMALIGASHRCSSNWGLTLSEVDESISWSKDGELPIPLSRPTKSQGRSGDGSPTWLSFLAILRFVVNMAFWILYRLIAVVWSFYSAVIVGLSLLKQWVCNMSHLLFSMRRVVIHPPALVPNAMTQFVLLHHLSLLLKAITMCIPTLHGGLMSLHRRIRDKKYLVSATLLNYNQDNVDASTGRTGPTPTQISSSP